MFRKTIYFVLAAAVLSSCQKLDEFTNFNLPLEQSVVIPANPTTGVTINIPIGEFETNLASKLAENDTELELIEQIFIESMELVVETPDGSNLDYFENISVYLRSTSSPEMKVAWKEPVPEGTAGSFAFDVWDTNMLSHFTKDVVIIRAELSADQVTSVDQTVNFKAVFRVNAKVLGI